MPEEYASAAGLQRAFAEIRTVSERTSANETDIAVLKSAVESIKDLPETMRDLQLTLREMQVEMRQMNTSISDIKSENKEQNTRMSHNEDKSKVDLLALVKDNIPWLLITGYLVLTKIGII